jgi:hypothetical protein
VPQKNYHTISINIKDFRFLTTLYLYEQHSSLLTVVVDLTEVIIRLTGSYKKTCSGTGKAWPKFLKH